MKPMLASDYDVNKLRFPLVAQPKIDGVRALFPYTDERLRARSLKSHANLHVTQLYSYEVFRGFDGEMAAEAPTHPNLCSLTTSALSTVEGKPWVQWHVFDYVTAETIHLPYLRRYELMLEALQVAQAFVSHGVYRIVPMPYRIIASLAELDAYDEENLLAGYEGTIVRDPNGAYKSGRSTVREGGLLRIKNFIDGEFRIEELVEGQTNENEAQVNELGNQFRSTHKDNMIPNGMVGALRGTLLKDLVDPVSKNVLFAAGTRVHVGAGRMTKKEREFYFQNPEQALGRIGKLKVFPKGIKDKPRFPTFQSFRNENDM